MAAPASAAEYWVRMQDAVAAGPCVPPNQIGGPQVVKVAVLTSGVADACGIKAVFSANTNDAKLAVRYKFNTVNANGKYAQNGSYELYLGPNNLGINVSSCSAQVSVVAIGAARSAKFRQAAENIAVEVFDASGVSTLGEFSLHFDCDVEPAP